MLPVEERLFRDFLDRRNFLTWDVQNHPKETNSESILFIFYPETIESVSVEYRAQIHALLRHSIEPQENAQARGEKQPQKRQKAQEVYQ